MRNIIDSLKRQREQLLAETGEDMLVRHASILEITVISLYNRMVNLTGVDASALRAGAAVAAVGSFGRGLSGPLESVELLFVGTGEQTWKDAWIREVTGPIEEAGWSVVVQKGTPAGLRDAVRKDENLFYQLLDMRYLSGNRDICEQVDDVISDYISAEQRPLLERLRRQVMERRFEILSPERWLEPDLVRNRGGLNDIRAIRAAVRMAVSVYTLEDGIFRGLLTRDEVDLLQRAEREYARLINFIADKGRKDSAVLGFKQQEVLAEKLRYAGSAGFLPVETFMRGLHKTLHSVNVVTEDFWERLDENFFSTGDEMAGTAENLEKGLHAVNGVLSVKPGEYEATVGSIIRLFLVAARRRLRFSNATRQWIRHHRSKMETAAADATVHEQLLDLLRLDEPDLPVFRKFYNYGLLRCLIPEIGPVHGLVQHDAFHVYPVNEHHLRSVTEIKKLFAGQYADTQPELTAIAHEIGLSSALHLAGLLHDIGKSAETSHADYGAMLIPTISQRLNLPKDLAQEVEFLVRRHTLLTDMATRRDISDLEMQAACAAEIGGLERLNMLALLSFAVMKSTGPKALRLWEDSPILDLYRKVRLRLEKGEPSQEAIDERIEHIRQSVETEVADLMDPDALREHFELCAPRYLLSTPPRAIARHLRLEWEFNQTDEPLAWEASDAGADIEITLVSREQPGLLARAAGVLTLHDLNIIGAQVYTKKNGIVLLVFHCKRLPGAAREAMSEAIREDIRKLLRGKLALDYRIAAHAANMRRAAGPMVLGGASDVSVDNESSSVYTILEVYTTDRVGRLYTIARTMMDLQIRIFVAKVTIKGDLGANIFYVKTADGEKVTDPEQLDELKKAVMFYLED